jgi:formyl-CoA transferase/CoA:oxalate CoA-transferase
MIDDPRFKLNRDRVKNRDAFCELLDARFASMTTQEALDLLNTGDVPCGPINNLEQVFQEPQIQHLGMRQTIQHPTIGKLNQIGMPYFFSETPAEIRLPPPLLGQHTEEILKTIGLTDADFAQLRKDGVI